ncbi:MAG: SOS response-associated peptidase [Asticcacaulis sp.]|nr:SOS response-associated peptidase [Asticcacaulis sp.]
MRAEKRIAVYAKNNEGQVVVKEMHHGLIPAHFTGYLSDWGASTSHVRVETVATTDAFVNAWARKRRVVFPLECYYGKASPGSDLTGRKGKAERVAIKRADDKPLGIAGIYDYAHLADGPLLSAAMLTRAPGKRMFDIHDREPVILEPEDWQAWLDGVDTLDLAKPWADDAFIVVPAPLTRTGRRAG